MAKGPFQGENYTFDSRVGPGAATMDEPCLEDDEIWGDNEVLGTCLYCSCPYDTYSGKNACTVCRALVLVCPTCIETMPHTRVSL